jgi:hypothetical protein
LLLRGDADPYPEDGDIPHIEAWQWCRRYSCDYESYRSTPVDVIAHFHVYDEALDIIQAGRRQS